VSVLVIILIYVTSFAPYLAKEYYNPAELRAKEALQEALKLLEADGNSGGSMQTMEALLKSGAADLQSELELRWVCDRLVRRCFRHPFDGYQDKIPVAQWLPLLRLATDNYIPPNSAKGAYDVYRLYFETSGPPRIEKSNKVVIDGEISIEFEESESRQSYPKYVKIRNLRTDRPLKLEALRIIGLFGNQTKVIRDAPGFVEKEAEPPCDIPPEDYKRFAFALSPAGVWRYGPDLTEYYAEVELRTGEKHRSNGITRPEIPNIPDVEHRQRTSKVLNSIQARLEQIKENVTCGTEGTEIYYILTNASLGSKDLTLQFVHQVEQPLLDECNKISVDYQWEEFRTLACMLVELNEKIAVYNKTARPDPRQASELLFESMQRIPQFVVDLLAQIGRRFS
jgi:hypothetical protein